MTNICHCVRAEPNVVPFSDILLVLLVIFMIITPMINQTPGLTPPEARHLTDQADPERCVTVAVLAGGEVRVAGARVDDLGKLAGLVKARMEEIVDNQNRVLLQADRDVAYGRLVDIMEKLRLAGWENVGLVGEQKATSL
jgi:biopolymer transport protein TolR